MGAGAQLQPTPSPMSSPCSNNLDKLDSIRYVNMTMRNQPYSRVFNALLITQMVAKLEDGLCM